VGSEGRWNYSYLAPFSRTGCPACSTKSEFDCGMGSLPVHKKLIENGARYKIIDLDLIIPIQPETILTSETFKKSHPFLGGGSVENY